MVETIDPTCADFHFVINYQSAYTISDSSTVRIKCKLFDFLYPSHLPHSSVSNRAPI